LVLLSPDSGAVPFFPYKREPLKKAAGPVDKIIEAPRFSLHIIPKDFSRSIDT
jgi:hypothetical protein